MKRVIFVFVLLGVLACSNNDDSNDCKKVTGMTAVEINNVWVYSISIDGAEPISTNKATIDFYKHAGAPECYEGMK